MITKIKQAREKNNKSQKECAEYFGLSLRAWQNYEQGIREPKFELLVNIANFFGVTTDYLLNRPEAKEPPDPIDQLTAQFDMSLLEKKILEEYLKLDEKSRGDFMEFLHKAVIEVQKESAKKEKPAAKEQQAGTKYGLDDYMQSVAAGTGGEGMTSGKIKEVENFARKLMEQEDSEDDSD